MIFIWIPLAILSVVVLSYGLVRLQGIWNAITVSAIGIGVTVYLIATDFQSLPGSFLFIKFLSVLAGALIICAIRFYNGHQKAWLRNLAYLTVFLNILEAVVFEIFDVVSGGPERLYGGSLLNAAAGAILIITFTRPGLLDVEKRHRNISYDPGIIWVLAYTVWNFVFVYGTNPPDRPTGEWSGVALMHLGAPLILMSARSDLYIQMRGYALFLTIALMAIAPFEPIIFRTPGWYHSIVAQILAWLSFTLAILLLWIEIRRGAKGGQANPVQWFLNRFS